MTQPVYRNGDTIKIGDMTAHKVFYKADQGRPPLVALYWRDGGMGYSLCGTLKGSLNEQMLINIAESIAVK